jgi:hypothetical protein
MKNGEYELVVAPDDYPGKRYRGKYAYEHRVVWWRNTGELPDESQVIHHINEDKTDNRFENLEVLSRVDHSSLHSEEYRTYVKMVCPCCGDEFIRSRNKTHLVKPNKATYCSRSCIGRMSGKDYKTFDQVVEIFEK